MKHTQKRIQYFLEKSGITLNGSQPWDIRVIDPRFFTRVLAQGSVGLGESYVDGWWESERLDEFFFRLLRAKISRYFRYNPLVLLDVCVAKLINLQSQHRSFIVGRKHYDLDNDLFRMMLDRRMTYSCGYWQHTDNLDNAQEAKLAMICTKLGLQPGMRVLDVGCGWGSFARFAALNHHVEVVGITVSAEQARLAQSRCSGLPVSFRVQDYRDLDEKFDRIVSVGMFEHVGPKNYRTYLTKMRSLLHEDGLFLLHTIGNNVSVHATDPWMAKYIFPNSVIPSMAQIARACEGLFAVEDWHNFGVFYDTTLMAWYRNFEKSLPELRKRYDERFCRMWKYYLLMCAGTFRARYCHLWQIVFSPNGIPGGYESIRENVYTARYKDKRHLSQPMNSYIEHADNRTVHTPPIGS